MNLDSFPTASADSPQSALSQSTQRSPDATSDIEEMLKTGLNVLPLLRTVQRKIFLVAGTTIMLTGLAAFQASRAPSRYQGRFELLVEPITTQGELADPTALTRGNNVRGGIDYATQLRILRSPLLLRDIAALVREQSPEYSGFSERNLERFLNVGRVGGGTRVGQTKILAVSYESTNPDLVEHVLKATADRYLQYSLEDRKTQFSQGIQFIEAQRPEIEQRVSSLQNRLQQLQQQFNIVNPEQRGEQLTARISVIEDLQQITNQELRERQALQERLKQQLESTPDEAFSASTLSQNPRYQALLNDLQVIEGEIRAESSRFSPASPVVQNLTQRRTQLEQVLRNEAEVIVGRPISPQEFVFQDAIRLDLTRQLLQTVNEIEVLEARSQEVAAHKQAVIQELAQFPEISRRYGEIERDLQISQRTLDQLLNQRELLKIESAQTEIPWEIVSAPVLDRDEFGNPVAYRESSKTVIVAFMGGGMLGLVLAFALEKWQDIFFVTEDVQDRLDLPLVGVIPFCWEEELESVAKVGVSSLKGGLHLGNGDRPPALSARAVSLMEAFSSLYLSLQDPATGELAIRSLVISSPEPGDGKATIIQNLAQTVAAVGKKVLVVDANLYRPALHQQFGLSNAKGLAEVLKGTISFEDALQSHSANLFVLSAGEPSMGNSRLLASETMKSLMQKSHSRFDFVIYGAPHALGLTDASILTAQTQGMYFVVSLDKTKYSNTTQALSQLSTYETPILGVIVNHVRAKTKNSYGYQNRYLQPQIIREIPQSVS
ncbi:MAG: polysaccharide biosynthesis tyrosine autokinase [Cyanothece sp. SIO2G6]|nr:polysaccharide biosynthesis tyrosine autokinase [Cyanothece sp. SIO2G6]